MNEMQVTPVDPNPSRNSVYSNVLNLQNFLASIFIPTTVYVQNYVMRQLDVYGSYYLDMAPTVAGNFMLLGPYGQQHVNVANFLKSLSGFTNNIEKYRYIYQTFVGGADFNSWLLNLDPVHVAVNDALGKQLANLK